jgi:hypothetical protein
MFLKSVRKFTCDGHSVMIIVSDILQLLWNAENQGAPCTIIPLFENNSVVLFGSGSVSAHLPCTCGGCFLLCICDGVPVNPDAFNWYGYSRLREQRVLTPGRRFGTRASYQTLDANTLLYYNNTPQFPSPAAQCCGWDGSLMQYPRLCSHRFKRRWSVVGMGVG